MSNSPIYRSDVVRGTTAQIDAVMGRLVTFYPRVLFGVRLAASVCLALYVTYFLELENSFWAATTAAIVCQPNLGASLQKARYRVLGTVVGALAMVQLLMLFPQSRNTLILCLALWCGLCGVATIMFRNFGSYAAALAGITATIVFADSLTDPANAFLLSVIRVGEICIGIGAAGFVMLLTDFGTASRQLANTLQQTAARIASGFLGTLTAGDDTPALQAARRDLARSLGAIDAQVDATIGESAFFRSRTGNLKQMVAALVSALVAWRNVGNHLARQEEDGAAIIGIVVPLLQRIDLSQLGRDPTGLQRSCREVIAQIRTIPSSNATGCMIVDASRDVAISLAATIDCVILLRDREGERMSWRPSPLVVTDPLPAILNGVRVFVAVLAMACFWVETAWPNGSFAVVFAAIGTLIFGSFGDQAHALAKDYAIGAVLMAVLGGGLYFAVLPALSTFPALAIVLTLLFLPIGILQAGTWHSVVFLAMSIVSLPLLGVGNPIIYSASDYFNLALAIVAGTVVGTMFFIVIPVVDPGRRAQRLVALSLRDFRSLADGSWHADQAGWTDLLTRRIEALPPQTTLEIAGRLTALLALGQAALYLRAVVPSEPKRRLLLQALDHLAAGRLSPAREALEQINPVGEAEPVLAPDLPTSPFVRLRAAVAVIVDATDAHAALLSAPANSHRLPLSFLR
ncbi:FUSC family protein [Azorhizobium sp. AG788]|uniref:FUSC family protein n=1 Tax=Azorhizobium sp. AG788 TaxID=2183897 RepID=UPI00313913E6